MAYYLEDLIFPKWSVVYLKPRDVYDMSDDIDDEICEHLPFIEQELSNFFENDRENIQFVREKKDDDLLPTNLEEIENNLE